MYLFELMPEEGWNNPESSRLTPLNDHELGFKRKSILSLMLNIGKARCPNLFRTLLRNFRVYFSFARFNAKIMPRGKLSRRHTELAILRVAWKTRSYYEWAQHVDIGLRAGLSADEIYRVTLGDDKGDWHQCEQYILRAVDDLVDQQAISLNTWSILSDYFDEQLMIELMFVINTYIGLACIINSVGVDLEPEVERVLEQTQVS